MDGWDRTQIRQQCYWFVLFLHPTHTVLTSRIPLNFLGWRIWTNKVQSDSWQNTRWPSSQHEGHRNALNFLFTRLEYWNLWSVARAMEIKRSLGRLILDLDLTYFFVVGWITWPWPISWFPHQPQYNLSQSGGGQDIGLNTDCSWPDTCFLSYNIGIEMMSNAYSRQIPWVMWGVMMM